MPIEMIEEFKQGARIKVIGVGGGGGNAVEHMLTSRMQGVEFIAANTDAQALAASRADQVLQLGDSGLGAGSKPDVGRVAAETCEERIREAIEGADMLFITAGMGGGTGTGAAPVIAKVAKEMGILTVGVVTKPFEFEGRKRTTIADTGLAELEAQVSSLIVVLNDKLLDVLGDEATQEQAFAFGNDVLKSAVSGIADVIHVPGLVNVDFNDVRTVMEAPGKALMGTARATGPDRARKAAEQAMACPLLDGIHLTGAQGVLVLIAASRNTFKLAEARQAMKVIEAVASEDADVKMGTAYDDSLGDALRVTVIATGLNGGVQAQRQAPTMQVVHSTVRTGTHDLPILTQTVEASAGMGGLNHLPGMAPGLTMGRGGNPDVPSVWRNGRAAQKVDALAASGLDDIEIPAFLRRQAD
ncbi:MAG: cell division protein FtsZ [Burkholderiales bacterium]|uniref:cell division protein FtsZ n=1 Tax=Inhella sp. TaxID=1921806 RepID=UPI001AC56E4A|nr:cell division protein FtsZ [Burkholderiales bacterium]